MPNALALSVFAVLVILSSHPAESYESLESWEQMSQVLPK